jgi:hypothetical protein
VYFEKCGEPTGRLKAEQCALGVMEKILTQTEHNEKTIES